jgi:hypothetical protein
VIGRIGNPDAVVGGPRLETANVAMIDAWLMR